MNFGIGTSYPNSDMLRGSCGILGPDGIGGNEISASTEKSGILGSYGISAESHPPPPPPPPLTPAAASPRRPPPSPAWRDGLRQMALQRGKLGAHLRRQVRRRRQLTLHRRQRGQDLARL
ncbi:unnamed protein product [Urochloa humidicola]